MFILKSIPFVNEKFWWDVCRLTARHSITRFALFSDKADLYLVSKMEKKLSGTSLSNRLQHMLQAFSLTY